MAGMPPASPAARETQDWKTEDRRPEPAFGGRLQTGRLQTEDLSPPSAGDTRPETGADGGSEARRTTSFTTQKHTPTPPRSGSRVGVPHFCGQDAMSQCDAPPPIPSKDKPPHPCKPTQAPSLPSPPNTLTHRRTDAPTHRRTDAPTHRRTDAPTHFLPTTHSSTVGCNDISKNIVFGKKSKKGVDGVAGGIGKRGRAWELLLWPAFFHVPASCRYQKA
jgi:hypothetical protein